MMIIIIFHNFQHNNSKDISLGKYNDLVKLGIIITCHFVINYESSLNIQQILPVVQLTTDLYGVKLGKSPPISDQVSAYPFQFSDQVQPNASTCVYR